MSLDNTSNTTWVLGERIGVSVIATMASVSCISISLLLSNVLYRWLRSRRARSTTILRSHLDIYLLALFFFDFIQSIGGIMDFRWVAIANVIEGDYCTTQGFLKQMGDVGVALCTMAIAIHTFAELILRWREPPGFIIPTIVLALFILFLLLITLIPQDINGHGYYGPTTYWCWITQPFLAEGIGLEYGWLWLTCLVTLSFYLTVFLVMNHYLNIEEESRSRSGYKIQFATKKQRDDIRLQTEKAIPVHQMLFYPAVYIITVLPVGIVRIHTYVVKSINPRSNGSIISTTITDTLFAASGFFNVMVYTITRPALLQPRPTPGAALACDSIFPEAAQATPEDRNTPNGDDASVQQI